MTVLWLLACMVGGVVVFVAARVAEALAALRVGRPRRTVWLVAMLYLTALSGAWLVPSQTSTSRTVVEWVTRSATSPVDRGTGGRVLASMLPLLTGARGHLIEAYVLAMCVSVSLLLAFVYWRHTRDRSTWETIEFQGMAVIISDGYGPALTGVLRPRIVIPRWVLELSDSAQRSILVHEIEHRRAGDHRLLAGACVLIVLNAWNPMMWMYCRRLLRAVELDCDERVVSRGIAPAEYASVLLDAYQRTSGWNAWLPSPALAERASGLGQRVENLFRPEARNIAMKTMTGTALVAMLATLTAFAPSPQTLRASTPVEPSAVDQMKNALRRLVAAEEAHYADHGTYTTDVTALAKVSKKPFNQDLVWVTVIFAGGRGWTGAAEFRGTKNSRCVVYIGDPAELPKLPKTIGQQSPAGEGAITCDQP